jgi:non-ribosomal peptide synthetase component F
MPFLLQAQVRHRNFIGCIRSLVHVTAFCEKDKLVQICRCSFDMHIQDIVGTLIIGATLVMLHPKGQMDFEYWTEVLIQKQITQMWAVPTLLQSLFDFIKENSSVSTIESLRSVCSGG